MLNVEQSKMRAVIPDVFYHFHSNLIRRKTCTHYLRGMLYPFIRKILFAFDAEAVHHFSMNTLKNVCSIGVAKKIISKYYAAENGSLSKEVFGLHFKNPVGLGAGFDKNALYLRELEALGFGFIEVGTVTPKPQAGNDKPRLFRLLQDKALINRMGFNNDGVAAVRARLEKWKNENTNSSLIIGGNIGKNKITENENAWKDYLSCFSELHDCADYFAVNVSSPNTPGLRALQEKDALKKILSELQSYNYGKQKAKPLLLKIAPDLTDGQTDDIAALALELQLSGLVICNTTVNRNNLKTPASRLHAIGAGGLSGLPLREASTAMLQQMIKKTGGKIPVISSGGIFTAQDAQQKLDAGASLLQVWTGFIYEGASIIKNICRQIEMPS